MSHFRTNDSFVVGEYSGLLIKYEGQKYSKALQLDGTLPLVKNINGQLFAATWKGQFLREDL